ncbi:MAG: phage tail tube protein [Chromatiales bacterium]
MPQARGTQTAFALYPESVYGTDPGTPSGQKLHLVSFGLQSNQALLDSNTLTAKRDRVRPIAGNLAVAGPMVLELSAQSQGTLLWNAMGANTTEGAGPYTHTLTLGDLPVSMLLEKDHGANITGVGRFERFNGCRIASVGFDFANEGFQTANFQLTGSKSVLAAAALSATPEDNGHTSFSAFEGSIIEGGAPIATVTSASINLDNELDDSVYTVGGLGVRRALPEGFATVSGTLTALFEDTSLLMKAINSTQSSLVITLSRGTGLGDAGNESMSFSANQLLYERSSPPIEGPRGLLLTQPFKAFRVADSSAFTIVIKNAVAVL